MKRFLRADFYANHPIEDWQLKNVGGAVVASMNAPNGCSLTERGHANIEVTTPDSFNDSRYLLTTNAPNGEADADRTNWANPYPFRVRGVQTLFLPWEDFQLPPSGNSDMPWDADLTFEGWYITDSYGSIALRSGDFGQDPAGPKACEPSHLITMEGSNAGWTITNADNNVDLNDWLGKDSGMWDEMRLKFTKPGTLRADIQYFHSNNAQPPTIEPEPDQEHWVETTKPKKPRGSRKPPKKNNSSYAPKRGGGSNSPTPKTPRKPIVKKRIGHWENQDGERLENIAAPTGFFLDE